MPENDIISALGHKMTKLEHFGRTSTYRTFTIYLGGKQFFKILTQLKTQNMDIWDI